MNDLISRLAAVDACHNWDEGKAAYAFGDMIAERLQKLPSIDPVKHGKWLKTEAFPHHVYCSECGKTYIPNDRWQIWIDGDLPREYCPNCGAKMDGEE